MNALGGVAIAALGLFVASVKPRRRANLTFAAMAIAFGSAFVFQWMVPSPDERLLPLWFAPAVIGLFAAALAAVAVAASFPSRLRPDEGRRALAASGLAAAFLVTAGIGMWRGFGPFFDATGYIAANRPWFMAFSFGLIALLGALFGFVALLSLRFADADGPERSQAALAAAGVVIWPSFTVGLNAILDFPLDLFRGFGVPGLFATVAVALLWVRVARGPDAHLARNVALLTLAAALVGMLVAALAGSPESAFRTGGFGIARIAGVAILAYAILRHQLLGIDVKVRWGISKTTVAAVFIAVFFVVSEGAQVLFGAENPWIGVGAAGALVFALAPLQRVADRLAERAVPAEPATAAVPSRSEAAYRVMVARLSRDGARSQADERRLADLAQALGIGAGDAMRIREEVEGDPADESGVA